MNKNLHKFLYMLLSLFLLSSCGGGGGGGNSNGASTGSNSITIDNAGIIPLINGSGTSTVIYVHNNSQYNITGITYTAVENKQGIGGLLIGASSATACASIPANGFCALSITAPVLTIREYQGSGLITAKYLDTDGREQNFNQVVNYQYVSSGAINGAQFGGPADINGFGNSVGYATVYLYGTGSGNVYNIKDLLSSKEGVTIVNGNMTGKQIQSGYVQAVEVRADMLNNLTQTKAQSRLSNSNPGSYLATLTAMSQATTGGVIYTATAMLGVDPVTNGAILTTGLAPIINTKIGFDGSLYVVNSGNLPATGITYVPGSGIEAGDNSAVGSCSDGSTLLPGEGCTYNFTITTAGNDSSDITVNYGASSLIQVVTWYDQAYDALLAMRVTPNPVNFTDGAGTATVTIINVGGSMMSNLGISPTSATGGATTVINNDTCTGESLILGASCTYDIDLSDSSTINNSGTVLTGVYGDYLPLNSDTATGYSRRFSFNYSSYGKSAVLNITPPTSNIDITGNAVDVATQVFKITNNGTQTAILSGYYLSGNPSYMIIDSESDLTTCSYNLTLAPDATCDLVVKLGTVTTSANVTGQTTLFADYNGGQGYSNTTAALIEYTVTPADVDLELSTVATTGDPCFMGSNDGLTNATPYQLNGGFCGYQQGGAGRITLSYTNAGDAPLMVVGLSESNSGNVWQLNNENTTCLLGNDLSSPTLLNEGDVCDVVFDYVLTQYGTSSIANIGASYTVDLQLPSFIVTYGGSQFVLRPQTSASDNIVYANSNQATISNSTEYESGVVTVAHEVANMTYDDGSTTHDLLASTVTATSLMEYYFVSIGVMTNCHYSMARGVLTQNCAIAPTTANNTTFSGLYNVDNAYESSDLHIIYGVSDDEQLVASTPYNDIVNLF